MKLTELMVAFCLRMPAVTGSMAFAGTLLCAQTPSVYHRQALPTSSPHNVHLEVVSIRPVDFNANKSIGGGATPNGCHLVMSVSQLIKFAYTPGWFLSFRPSDPTVVLNAPEWGYYAIDARVSDQDREAWQAQGKDQSLLRDALREVLDERFHLALHTKAVDIPIYDLVVSRKGLRLTPSPPNSVVPAGYTFHDGGVSTLFSKDRSKPARFYNASISDLAQMLQQDESHIDRPIHDGTGLTGHYDFELSHVQGTAQDVDPREYFLVKDLGLELKLGRGKGIHLVVDHIDKPSPN